MSPSGLRRQVVALETEGSNPSTHPTVTAPIAQRTEHRSSELALSVLNSSFAFILGLFCLSGQSRFECKVSTGDVLLFLVR